MLNLFTKIDVVGLENSVEAGSTVSFKKFIDPGMIINEAQADPLGAFTATITLNRDAIRGELITVISADSSNNVNIHLQCER